MTEQKNKDLHKYHLCHNITYFRLMEEVVHHQQINLKFLRQ
jgi:hypothetical protein